MASVDREKHRIAAVYAKRDTPDVAARYSYFSPDVVFTAQERERKVLQLLKRHGYDSLRQAKIFDVGCGAGGWLRDFVRWGAEPENIGGIELLPDRAMTAERLCPVGVSILRGCATKIDAADGAYDIVLQSVVFTSILDERMRHEVAAEMLRILAPKGLILWYDFLVNNPRNPDVRSVKRAEINRLFPGCRVDLHRVTLAPPLARRLAPRAMWLCHLLHCVPLLRTHYLASIRRA